MKIIKVEIETINYGTIPFKVFWECLECKSINLLRIEFSLQVTKETECNYCNNKDLYEYNEEYFEKFSKELEIISNIQKEIKSLKNKKYNELNSFGWHLNFPVYALFLNGLVKKDG